MDELNIIAVEKDNGMRLDSFITEKMPECTRSSVQKIIRQNNVSVNGKCAKSNYRVKEGDRVRVVPLTSRDVSIDAANIPIDIVYEDDGLLVLNKPAGMVVHPAPGNKTNTLINALLYHCDSLSGVGGAVRSGIVHRLDKDTTGLLVVAKNEAVHRCLVKQFKERTVIREYLALVKGVIEEDSGLIDAPIGRHRTDRKKMAVIAHNSRYALTHFKVIERYSGHTLIEIRLKTGRTHQIRVHMHYIGYPIVGDLKYGRSAYNATVRNIMLHAAGLGFVHPENNEFMKFRVPPPEHFKRVIEGLLPPQGH